MPAALQRVLNGVTTTAQLRNQVSPDGPCGSAKRVVEADGRLLATGCLLPNGRPQRRWQGTCVQLLATARVTQDPVTCIRVRREARPPA